MAGGDGVERDLVALVVDRVGAVVDHGPDGTGEPLAVLLRAGNAGSNTAADHIAVARAALRQLPGHRRGKRPGRRVLVRADGAGATHDFLGWVSGQRLSYSVGFTLPDGFGDQLRLIPTTCGRRRWTPTATSGTGHTWPRSPGCST